MSVTDPDIGPALDELAGGPPSLPTAEATEVPDAKNVWCLPWPFFHTAYQGVRGDDEFLVASRELPIVLFGRSFLDTSKAKWESTLWVSRVRVDHLVGTPEFLLLQSDKLRYLQFDGAVGALPAKDGGFVEAFVLAYVGAETPISTATPSATIRLMRIPTGAAAGAQGQWPSKVPTETVIGPGHRPFVGGADKGFAVVYVQDSGQDYALMDRGDRILLSVQGGSGVLVHQAIGKDLVPTVTAMADGRWLIVWNQTDPLSGGADLFCRVYSEDGTALGPAQHISSVGQHRIQLNSMSVAALGNGGFVLAGAGRYLQPDSTPYYDSLAPGFPTEPNWPTFVEVYGVAVDGTVNFVDRKFLVTPSPDTLGLAGVWDYIHDERVLQDPIFTSASSPFANETWLKKWFSDPQPQPGDWKKRVNHNWPHLGPVANDPAPETQIGPFSHLDQLFCTNHAPSVAVAAVGGGGYDVRVVWVQELRINFSPRPTPYFPYFAQFITRVGFMRFDPGSAGSHVHQGAWPENTREEPWETRMEYELGPIRGATSPGLVGELSFAPVTWPSYGQIIDAAKPNLFPVLPTGWTPRNGSGTGYMILDSGLPTWWSLETANPGPNYLNEMFTPKHLVYSPSCGHFLALQEANEGGAFPRSALEAGVPLSVVKATLAPKPPFVSGLRIRPLP